ncbi:hypothetical protein D3C75_807640 [compost metagenome]
MYIQPVRPDKSFVYPDHFQRTLRHRSDKSKCIRPQHPSGDRNFDIPAILQLIQRDHGIGDDLKVRECLQSPGNLQRCRSSVQEDRVTFLNHLYSLAGDSLLLLKKPVGFIRECRFEIHTLQ